ncbi:hypothetical protein KUTeg_023666 [Tegillarca granosa]|uniref:Methyltransferase domain-containing protein n=1 Tax=Tegillarca granosa TaxID=220873 RepID=A0ABQ9E771_TEGGR|nr:hypothetical protein KUTeg_023666 [Tegillarca granosa]
MFILFSSKRPGFKLTTSTAPNLMIDSSRQLVFQNIYNRHYWGKAGRGSGLGSAIEYTEILRKHLLEFVSRYNLSSMTDIPCGGMEWTEVFLQSVWQRIPSFIYIGMDITESVVKQLKKRWKGNTKVTIKLADLVLNLPHINADFVLTRDALQHMSFQDACLAIDNLINIGNNVKYVLIGTYRKSLNNTRIKTGGYYPINIIKEPFNLPEPDLIIKERPDIDQKFLYVFQMKNLQIHRCQICKTYVTRNKCQ